MTKDSEPHGARGLRRRAELVEAGVALLAEQGWDGVTHRAVAARAQANPGLVHYYFQGTAGLRLAVAEQASHQSIGALVDDLLSTGDADAFLDRLAHAVDAARADPATARVTTAMAGAALDDPAIGALVGGELARARTRVEQWLAALDPSRPPERTRGDAAVLVAMIDGLVLHLLLDPSMQAGPIIAALTFTARTIIEGSRS